MTFTRKHAAVLLGALMFAAAAAFCLHAQPQPQLQPQPAQPPSLASSAMNRNLIVLDPAHGGPEAGAMLGSNLAEKDFTLAVSTRLRAALMSAGFTVIATRDSDPSDALSTDQRAETANRTHAIACIVLHATASGSGVHIYTSTLQPAPAEFADPDSPATFIPIPWETAQAGFVSESQRMAGEVSAALGKASLPTLTGQAPLRPLDNLMCPAVAVEIAPLLAAGEDATPVTDPDYQQRIVGALTTAMKTWRDHAELAASASAAQSAQKAPQ